MSLPLTDQVALVTGGSRGIGAAIALALAEAGAAIGINYRSRSIEAEAVADAINQGPCRAVTIQADVSNSDAVTGMVESVSQRLGPIDILINNAGIASIRGIDDLTEADFNETISVNLKSAFLCTQAVLPHMRAQRWGRIVNISSGAARGGGWSGCALQCLEGRHGGADARLRRPAR
jgi:3-oxoacyl-[acyl-carrier protein] reductase